MVLSSFVRTESQSTALCPPAPKKGRWFQSNKGERRGDVHGTHVLPRNIQVRVTPRKERFGDSSSRPRQRSDIKARTLIEGAIEVIAGDDGHIRCPFIFG
mmetsp:Transcript_20734/g.28204  ORF Transcript_20734/g.28204 Transcript_20734/m.28204 type:complete len:100 (-) Transcript_20734:137-436(-)